ncbi:MAG: SHOCT domain-containing protein [Culturomica sp.]|nr:SHOCT domain-containing protein [Culturomica sp.]
MLGLLYALPYAIVGLVKSRKKQEKNATQELIALNELKEKGILSEDEFQAKKTELLKV